MSANTESNTIHIANSAVYAMQMLQEQMLDEAERTGLIPDIDEAVIKLVAELRNE